MITNDSLATAIQSAISLKVKEIVDEEAALAATNVDRRVRGMATEIAATVLTKFSMQMFQNELVIRVELPEIKK